MKSSKKGEDQKKHRKLLPDENEAQALRKCFEMYASGNYSFQDLADYLNDNGFVPRRNNEERKSVFNKETIRSMMENPIYVGYLIHRNSDSEDGYEYFEAKQYAIIDKELFDQVDVVRKSRVANHAHNKADGVSLKKNYLVQNLICCAECGNRLRVHPSNKGYHNTDNIYWPMPIEDGCG